MGAAGDDRKVMAVDFGTFRFSDMRISAAEIANQVLAL